MSDGYVFNPNQWYASTLVDGISNQTLSELDARYINVGENILSETISTLNLVHLNLASSGNIYFNNDNTTQTTAYDPNFVTNKINGFLTSNNTFTGINKFTNFNVLDPSGTQFTQLYQEGRNFYINNQNYSSNIYIQVVDPYSNLKTITIDGYCNMVGISNLNVISLDVSSFIQLTGACQLLFNSSNNFLLSNNSGGIQLQANTNNLLYDTSGNLTGVNNLSLGNSLTSSNINFTGTNAKIYQTNSDLVIDNNVNNSFLKIKNYSSGIMSQITIDSLSNITGINNLNCNKLYSGTSLFQNSNGALNITNQTNGNSIILQNHNTSGTLTQVTFDSNMNCSGINDLYVQRIFFNNTLFNPIATNTTITNTQMISYIDESASMTKQTRIMNGTNNGFYFIPSIETNKNLWNGAIQTGDHVIVSDNGNLTLTKSSLTITGLRITDTGTQLYNTKVDSNGIIFNDGTQQTTAMTTSYLTSLIQSVVNQMSIAQSIPIGTIFAYSGQYLDNNLNYLNPPTGYLWCFGGTVSQTTYSNLYSVIGNMYLYTRTIPTGQFYLPDFRGAFLKGVGTNSNFTNQTQTLNVGEIQQCNVGTHMHSYTDRGDSSKSVSSASGSVTTTTIANNTSSTYWTSDACDSSTHIPLNLDTRPNSISINYIIKY